MYLNSGELSEIPSRTAYSNVNKHQKHEIKPFLDQKQDLVGRPFDLLDHVSDIVMPPEFVIDLS